MTQQVVKTERRYTYADYCHWPDDERWELIEGVPYGMSPAPARAHQDVTGELFFQIRSQLESRTCKVYSAPFDVRLPRPGEADEQSDTVVQPDISVICDPDKLDERGCRGAPDWIIEVLSPKTAVKDQVQKRALYERHGVREYWLVHPVDRVLTVYRLEAEGYGKPHIQETSGMTESAVIEGLNIDWDRIFPAPPMAQPSPAGVG
jgi:Uma2 family endonuclease